MSGMPAACAAAVAATARRWRVGVGQVDRQQALDDHLEAGGAGETRRAEVVSGDICRGSTAGRLGCAG